eukprot:SAG11_NODE_394_length_9826_cov_3.333607_9_plen_169_part_00
MPAAFIVDVVWETELDQSSGKHPSKVTVEWIESNEIPSDLVLSKDGDKIPTVEAFYGYVHGEAVEITWISENRKRVKVRRVDSFKIDHAYESAEERAINAAVATTLNATGSALDECDGVTIKGTSMTVEGFESGIWSDAVGRETFTSTMVKKVTNEGGVSKPMFLARH